MADTLTSAPDPGHPLGASFLPHPSPPGPRGLTGFLGAVLRTCGLLLLVPLATYAFIAVTGVEPVEPGNIGTVRAALDAPPGLLVAFMAVVGIVEETVFRIVPLGLALWLTRAFRAGVRLRAGIVAAVALLSSAAFGLAHGNVQALLIQGVAGLVFCLAFLRYARLRSWWYASLVVIVAHAAYDIGMVAALKGAQSLLGERMPFP